MSFSETSNLIEEVGYEKAFKYIYLEYKKSKKKYAEAEKAYLAAKYDMEYEMSQANHFLQRAAQNNLTTIESGNHYVRRIIGDEVVYFRSGENGTYFIGYDPITKLKI